MQLKHLTLNKRQGRIYCTSGIMPGKLRALLYSCFFIIKENPSFSDSEKQLHSRVTKRFYYSYYLGDVAADL